MRTLNVDFYLVCKRNPSGRWDSEIGVRTTKTTPALHANEIAIKCSLALPAALFERPALSARISIPDEAVPSTEINMELASNIQDLVQQHLGLNLVVGVEEPPAEQEP